MALSRVSSMMESGGQSVALEENQAQILFTSDNLFFFLYYILHKIQFGKKKKKKIQSYTGFFRINHKI